MGNLPLAEKPFDVVALDSILGLGDYNSTKNCLHVIVDHHSRYIWAYPSKSTPIATYINIINQLLNVGKPKIIVTDRYPSFVSKRFNKFIQEKGIKHVMTSPSHLQCNGLVERANATIISKLRLHHQQNPRIPWPKLLQKALEEYRSIPHSITKMPPVYLLFGITPSYINKLTKAYPPIEEARRIANENTEKLHLKLVKRYNESHKTPNLKIGDKVLHKIPFQSGQGKLMPAFYPEPYTIISIPSPQTIEIDKPCQPENKHATIVNISKVKLWDPVTENNTEPPFPFQEEEDLEGCLGVEPNKQASTDSPQVLFSSIKKNPDHPTEPLEKLMLVSVDTQTESEPVVSCEVFQRSTYRWNARSPKKYLIAARVQEPSEWYKITTQLKLSTNKEEEPQQPSTSTSIPVKKFNSNSSKAQYQPFPRTAAATHHQQEPYKSINQPPYPCKICASHQLPNQFHFHRDCPLKNNNHPKRINPDASSLGVAGVLKQPDEQGILHPIGYFSRKLHPYEQNYTASEIETLAIINSVQRFHTYLHNIHFTLHTDHLPLKWIKNVKNPQGRLFRWSLILSQYSFDIKHIKGLNNIEADMLSRAPVSFYLTYNELKEHQSTEQISSAKIKIQNGLYIIHKKGFKIAYVPQTLRHKLLNKVHTKHGHIETTQMTKIISPHYYWPHMTRDIANYTKHCETCQFNKSRDNRIVYGPLQQMPIATHPNHIFSLYTLGGLHNYGTTRHSIHMILDHHSRFLCAFPTKSVSTDSYITCLRNLFQINKPEILITDRNAAFLSNKFKHFLDRNNVNHLLTSAHHPETNAKVERLNSTIINRLRCEYNANLNIPWTKYIPKITESYNETVHTTTGFTPKFLYYGIQPQYIEHDTETHTPIEKARKLAIERTIKSHEQSKQLYDIKHPEPIFKEGDQVLVKTFIYPNTGKLTQRYRGPFSILKQLSPVTYEINKPNLPQRKQTEIIHSNKLKLFYPETDFLLHYSTNIENDLIANQNSNTKLIDIDDKPRFLQEGHILDMDNEEQISAPILKPSQIT
ncbi:hypothetical protein LAZ67_3001404 [Cordylochernes scorpioides]|uniref:RNA-directed DNA polymerase n=1 Tax=Cordylochernes scorpioides TaxID=51811 RepID=A0ABY6K720_9ARAC|nr:hypothetical protein LAZ67_3001404 [Cordylochernes scorpioides]